MNYPSLFIPSGYGDNFVYQAIPYDNDGVLGSPGFMAFPYAENALYSGPFHTTLPTISETSYQSSYAPSCMRSIECTSEMSYPDASNMSKSSSCGNMVQASSVLASQPLAPQQTKYYTISPEDWKPVVAATPCPVKEPSVDSSALETTAAEEVKRSGRRQAKTSAANDSAMSRNSEDVYQNSESDDYDFIQKRRRSSLPWSREEDDALASAVKIFGFKNWKAVSKYVYDSANRKIVRFPDQCSQHWSRVLNPTITKGKWSQTEDLALVAAVKMCKPREWRQVAELLHGRTDIQVRYRMKRIGPQLVKRGVLDRIYLP